MINCNEKLTTSPHLMIFQLYYYYIIKRSIKCSGFEMILKRNIAKYIGKLAVLLFLN
jgi:hypothetical protein